MHYASGWMVVGFVGGLCASGGAIALFGLTDLPRPQGQTVAAFLAAVAAVASAWSAWTAHHRSEEASLHHERHALAETALRILEHVRGQLPTEADWHNLECMDNSDDGQYTQEINQQFADYNRIYIIYQDLKSLSSMTVSARDASEVRSMRDKLTALNIEVGNMSYISRPRQRS